jgi:hypothetical protein
LAHHFCPHQAAQDHDLSDTIECEENRDPRSSSAWESSIPSVAAARESEMTQATPAMSADLHFKGVSAPKSSKPPKLREVYFDDHPQVAALALKFGLDADDLAAWKNLWLDNPTFRESKVKFPMGWVLETAEGSIAGYLGNIPMRYEFEGRRILVAIGRSWVVDAAYRPYSLLLMGTYFQQANIDLFLTTSVNPRSAVPLGVFQWIRVPKGAWDRTLFWITDPQGFSESYFRKKGWAAAKLLSHPLSLGISLQDRFRGDRFRKTRSDFAVRSCSAFDDRFDAFWTALKKKKSKLLLAVRDRETLEWHFKLALLNNAAWIYTLEESRGLIAYALFLRHDRRLVGLKRVCLVDFQCLEPEKASAVLTAMLRAAFERCREESVHMLELIGPTPLLEECAERNSPHRRQLANWMYFYKTNDRSLSEKLLNADVWEPSVFDGDSGL